MVSIRESLRVDIPMTDAQFGLLTSVRGLLNASRHEQIPAFVGALTGTWPAIHWCAVKDLLCAASMFRVFDVRQTC
jgi:hypothetical protein